MIKEARYSSTINFHAETELVSANDAKACRAAVNALFDAMEVFQTEHSAKVGNVRLQMIQDGEDHAPQHYFRLTGDCKQGTRIR